VTPPDIRKAKPIVADKKARNMLIEKARHDSIALSPFPNDLICRYQLSEKMPNLDKTTFQ
jgi:hypothetical protein